MANFALKLITMRFNPRPTPESCIPHGGPFKRDSLYRHAYDTSFSTQPPQPIRTGCTQAQSTWDLPGPTMAPRYRLSCPSPRCRPWLDPSVMDTLSI